MSEVADKIVQRSQRAQRDKRLSDSRKDWLTAIELLREDDGEQLGHARGPLGELERKLGDGESARAQCEEAVALFRQHGDGLRLAHTVRHLVLAMLLAAVWRNDGALLGFGHGMTAPTPTTRNPDRFVCARR